MKKDDARRDDASHQAAQQRQCTLPRTPGAIPAPGAQQAPRGVHWEQIPCELRQRHQWLVAGPNDAGQLKMPRSVSSDGRLCAGSSTNASTWLSFEQAAHSASTHGLGIGYVLSGEDPYTCVDLDVKNPHNAPNDPSSWTAPEVLDRFNAILNGLDSYTEISQSGQGLHIWCRGKLGKGLKRDGVELYSQERFIVCTGNVLRDKPIADRSLALLNMASQMREHETSVLSLTDHPPIQSDPDHWMKKASARNGTKFVSLWYGNDPCDGLPMRHPCGLWRSRGFYPSQSEADFALMEMLMFNNASNAQCKRLFRRSALGVRPKALKDDRYLDLMLLKLRSEEAARRKRFAAPSSGLINAAVAPPKGMS